MTRRTVGLIDVFLQSSWVQKLLFRADRDVLAGQALNDGVKVHLLDERGVHIRTANIDPNKRLRTEEQPDKETS
jgi:type I site-specific restriction endonuclease